MLPLIVMAARLFSAGWDSWWLWEATMTTLLSRWRLFLVVWASWSFWYETTFLFMVRKAVWCMRQIYHIQYIKCSQADKQTNLTLKSLFHSPTCFFSEILGAPCKWFVPAPFTIMTLWQMVTLKHQATSEGLYLFKKLRILIILLMYSGDILHSYSN